MSGILRNSEVKLSKMKKGEDGGRGRAVAQKKLCMVIYIQSG